MWHAAPAIVIEQYRDLAKDAKAAHRLLHPTYNYRPRRSFEKKRRMSKKKATALKAIAATTTAAAQANQQLARPNSALNAVPTSSTSGDFIDFNISTENSSIELQGSGLSLKLVDNNAAVQVKDSGAASGGFVPREDFEVHISGDNPELAYVDMSLDAANHDRYFADFDNQFAFADTYERLNGDGGGGSAPLSLTKFPTFTNQLYDFESQTYDQDLQDVFFEDN
ncbi:hypothetical protein IFR05_009069 [Cadophora sp. M221]|nr:hypothetical protein IFR05_009069 [Cadophora sp. M221]